MLNRMGNITPNFKWYEFADLTSANLNNEVQQKIAALCKFILEPARQTLNKPLLITSGFRTNAENEKIGGYKNSHHLYLADHSAVDVTIINSPIEELYEFVKENTFYRYVILYPLTNKKGKRNFIHISGPDSSGIYGKNWIENIT